MTIFENPELLLKDQGLAKKEIVRCLSDGSLALFLGAGLSMSVSKSAEEKLFPSWRGLVENCCAACGIAFDGTLAHSNEYLRTVSDQIEAHCQKNSENLCDVVKENLYKDVPEYSKEVMKTDLLVALGSLIMNSIGGSVSSLVSYNYDDLLEWYLHYHGFRVNIVSSYPTLLSDGDVTVYHPHGFLPRTTRFTPAMTHEKNDLIFGQRSYERAVDEQSWNSFQKSLFGTKVALFVGMSGDDPHIKTLYGNTYEMTIKKKRIVGFMIMTDSAENRKTQNGNIMRGIVNYYIPDHNDLPDELLSICRGAADL